jgi:hypothetical protein
VRILAESHCGIVKEAWMTNVDLLLTPALTAVAVAGCHDAAIADAGASKATAHAVEIDR